MSSRITRFSRAMIMITAIGCTAAPPFLVRRPDHHLDQIALDEAATANERVFAAELKQDRL